jgi:uncharacterized protein YndB with AHSA1/START domain
MTTLAEHTRTVPVPAAALFTRWADVDSHPEWSKGLEWTRLDGPVELGARGRLKPSGGPSWRFEVTELAADRVFADTTYLPGARLTFRHAAEPVEGGSEVRVSVDLSGPMAWLWTRVLGGPAALQADIEKDLTALVALLQPTS